MVRATWNGAVVAESDDTVVVEGNHYFPDETLRHEHLRPSERRTLCPWKGWATYFDVEVDGAVNDAAAWTYRNPTAAAGMVRRRVAFGKGVRIEVDGEEAGQGGGILARLRRRLTGSAGVTGR